MTGDIMKSDCTMESRYRSEGRPSLPRRRVTTKTSHENGDFEMELSLAIKESLKYAKEKEGQLKSVDKTSPLLNGVKSDESFSQMAGKMLSFATSHDQGQGSEEVQQLKDLLLIHIELIQHQQEQLASKDKEIRILRNEKDTLHFRLQKVEKRLTQLKQRDDTLEAQVARGNLVAADVASAPADKNKLIPRVEQPPSRKRKQPRKSRPKKVPKVTKQTADTDKASESVTSEEEDDADDSGSDEEEGEGEDEEVEGSGEGEGEEVEEDSMEEGGVVKEEGEQKDPHPEPVLRTDCLYHVSCCVDVPVDEPVEPVDEKEVVCGDQVETPGWRINVLTNRYQLEGTENITDEAYQKRHQKHEMEEKRRKRWDIQRMREQKVFEKLRGKEEVAGSSSQSDPTPSRTFLPSIDDLTHIEISEHIPVMAFGQAVPHIEPSEFEVPWDTGPSSSFTRKSHGGRGRQK